MFRNTSVKLTAGESYVVCFVHIIVIYFFPIWCLGKAVEFLFICTFGETIGLIFACWEFSF